MSWFRGVATNNKSELIIPGTGDTTWLKADTNLYTNARKKLVVASVSLASGDEPQLNVQLKKPIPDAIHKSGAEIWFTLDKSVADEFCNAHGIAGGAGSSSSNAASAYPSLADGSNKATIDGFKSDKGGGRGRGGRGGGSRRNNNDDDGSANNGPAVNASNLLSERPHVDDYDTLGSNDKDGACCAFGAQKKSFCGPFWFMLTLHVGVLMANLYLCNYIGTFRVWTAVVGYVFLGYQVMAMASSVVVYVFAKNFFFEELKFVNVGLIITNFILVLSIGIPYAWSAGRQNAANNLLEGPVTKTIDCYRKPNMTFNQFDTGFLTFAENAWMIDYETRSKQKIVADVEADGSSTPDYYNYLVAPMRYTGNVPCALNIYVACFATTRKKAGSDAKLTSLKPDSVESKACGWNFPVTSIVLRVIQNNEAFFNFGDASDSRWWYKAWKLTGPTANLYAPPGQPSNTSVFTWYGGEGPGDIQKQLEASQDSERVIMICWLAIGIPMLALVAALMIKSAMDSSSSDDCGDCDGCDCDCD